MLGPKTYEVFGFVFVFNTGMLPEVMFLLIWGHGS